MNITPETPANNETPIIMENVLFTKEYEKNIGTMKMTESAALFEFLGANWKVEHKVERHYNILKRILINSVKNN